LLKRILNVVNIGDYRLTGRGLSQHDPCTFHQYTPRGILAFSLCLHLCPGKLNEFLSNPPGSLRYLALVDGGYGAVRQPSHDPATGAELHG
jgi:hypothetical protein